VSHSLIHVALSDFCVALSDFCVACQTFVSLCQIFVSLIRLFVSLVRICDFLSPAVVSLCVIYFVGLRYCGSEGGVVVESSSNIR
jgi:hypothetical protein